MFLRVFSTTQIHNNSQSIEASITVVVAQLFDIPRARVIISRDNSASSYAIQIRKKHFSPELLKGDVAGGG